MKKKRTTKKRKLVRRLIAVLVVVLVLPAVALLVGLPLLARWGVFTPYVQETLEETLGWKTQVGAIDLSPLSEFTAKNIVLGGAQSRISCRSVRVRFAPLDLLRTGRIESVEITGLRALLAQDSEGNWDFPQAKPAKDEKPFDTSVCRRITLHDAKVAVKFAAVSNAGEAPARREFTFAGIEGEISAVDAPPAMAQTPGVACFTFSVLGFLAEQGGRRSEACRFGASGTIFDPAGNTSVETRVLAATLDLKRLLAVFGLEGRLGKNELSGEAQMDAGILYREAPPAGGSKLSADIILQGEKLCWQKQDAVRPALEDGELLLSGKFYTDMPFPNRLLGLDMAAGLSCRTETNAERAEFAARLPQLEVFFGDAAVSAAPADSEPTEGQRAADENATPSSEARKSQRSWWGCGQCIRDATVPAWADLIPATSIVRFVAAMEKLSAAGTPLDEAVSAIETVKTVVEVSSSSLEEVCSTTERAGNRQGADRSVSSPPPVPAQTQIDFSCLTARMKSGAEIAGNARLSLGKDTRVRAHFESDGVEMNEILRQAGFDTTVVWGRGACRATIDGNADVTERGDIAFDGTAVIDVEPPEKAAAELCVPIGNTELSVLPRGILYIDVRGGLDGDTRDLRVNLDAFVPNGLKLGGSALVRPVTVGGRRLLGFARAALPRKENIVAGLQPGRDAIGRQRQPGDATRPPKADAQDGSTAIVWREVSVELARGLVPLLAAPSSEALARGEMSVSTGSPLVPVEGSEPAPSLSRGVRGSETVAFQGSQRNARRRQTRIAALLKLAGAGLQSVPVGAIQQVASAATGVECIGGEVTRGTPGADGDLTVSGIAIGLCETTVEDILAVRAIADSASGLSTTAGDVTQSATGQPAAAGAARGEENKKSLLLKFIENPRERLKKGKTNFSFAATRRTAVESEQAGGNSQKKTGGGGDGNWRFCGALFPERWAISFGDEILAAEKVRGVVNLSGTVGTESGSMGAPVTLSVSGQLGFDALLADRFFLQEDRLGFSVNALYEPADGDDNAGKLRILAAKVGTPSYGTVKAAGMISWGAGAPPDFDLHVRLDDLLHERIFKDFLQDPYGETHAFLKEAALTGTTSAGLHVYTASAADDAGGGEQGRARPTLTSLGAGLPSHAASGAGADSSGKENIRDPAGTKDGLAPSSLRIDGKINSVGDLKLWDVHVRGCRLQTPVRVVAPLSGEVAQAAATAATEEAENVPPLDRGWLRIARIETGPIVIPAVATRLAVAGNDIFCYDPISFDLFGGEVGIADIAITDLWGEATSSARLRCKGRIADMDLELMSSAYGIRYGLEGDIDADFEEIEISSEHVLLRGRSSAAQSGTGNPDGIRAASVGERSSDVNGGSIRAASVSKRSSGDERSSAPATGDGAGVHVNLFGGEVNVTKLAVARPLSDMRGLTLSLDFEGIDLERVTRSFAGIGRMSGILRGNLNNLEVVGGDLIGFETWVETVPQPKTAQRISPEAIQNLQKLTSGIQGVVEDYIKHRDWPYLHLGFYAQLKGGRCRFRGRYFRHEPFLGFIPSVGKLPDEYVLSGKIDEDVEEYFVITTMGGVNIINGTPGNTVRYDDLVSTVKSILEGRTKPRIE